MTTYAALRSKHPRARAWKTIDSVSLQPQSFRRKLIAGMSRRMTRQRDELHAVDDWLGATKRVPLTGLDVRRCDGLRTLEERLRILRRLSSDFRRQPKVAFGLRDVNIGIWEDALSVLSGQAAHES